MSKPVEYEIQLRCPDPDGSVKRIFDAEDKMQTDRFSYSYEKQDEQMLFTIRAKDPVALRAAINGVLKNMILIEQMEDIA